MKTLQYKFIELVPDELEEGIIYISIPYCSAIHKCVCGCGNEVVTPISPEDWKLSFDGRTISLYPSIGNWKFKCQSHYFIINSEIIHARKWNEKKISNRIENNSNNIRNISKKKSKKNTF